ncbi:MAG: dTMP kinase [Pseudonocardiaceae bacterium]
MSERPGFFVVIEGPNGVGKTTVTAMLHKQLASRGLQVFATTEPSDSRLGTLARQGTADYRGLVLACLVTADRYHHLQHDIRPALRAGAVVLATATCLLRSCCNAWTTLPSRSCGSSTSTPTSRT